MSKPDLAAVATDLLRSSHAATLSTQSIKHPGYPFASFVEYALDERELPMLLLSSMATHSKNIAANQRASLLVTADGGQSNLSQGRATLVGDLVAAPESKQDSLKQRYVAAIPSSAQYVSFGDFRIFQLQLVELYVIAGFGTMGWVDAETYLS